MLEFYSTNILKSNNLMKNYMFMSGNYVMENCETEGMLIVIIYPVWFYIPNSTVLVSTHIDEFSVTTF